MSDLPEKKHICKCCGAKALIANRVSAVGSKEDAMEEENEGEKTLYVCILCNDSWTSTKHVEQDGTCIINFVHLETIEPVLSRVAYANNNIVINEDTIDKWAYFIGDDRVSKTEWLNLIRKRRKVIKAIITN